MEIQTIAQAEAALLPYVPLVRELTGKDTTLQRIKPLMALLGNPQDQLQIVHIAGTSGKTSTAYYMSALLTATGQKVGLTVSPHIDSITERLQINGQPLDERHFCQLLGEFLEIIQQAEQQPSYFELLYAFALWVFARESVDYAVVETGVGGLHDATNVANRADKVCIITDIGFDHVALLGNTLARIAAQKIGIVHPGNQVFSYRQKPEVMSVFQGWVGKQPATLHIIDENEEPNPEIPSYQRRNWNLAYSVYQFLQRREHLPNLTRQELHQTQQLQVPGRMDIRNVAGKTLVMDGAHNEAKLAAFIASFQVRFPSVKPAVLVALKQDKDYEAAVKLLAPFANQVIITTFATTQDLPVQSLDPAMLAKEFQAQGIDAQVIPDQMKALKALLQAPDTVVVITGSFYLLSQLRRSTLLA